MKILGSLLGAIIAPLLLVVTFAVLYRAPRENWDHGSPMALMTGIAYLIPVGAIAGYRVANALQKGRSTAALRIASFFALLSVLPAIYIVGYPYLPQRAIKPAKKKERLEWAKTYGGTTPDKGWSL